VLVLSSNQLSGSIPRQLGNLSSLSELQLSDNQLSGPIPHELSNLGDTLQYLDLGNNEPSLCLPWSLGELVNELLGFVPPPGGFCD
jgi:hypothetical protein